jgi:hypothetical protein
MAKRKASGMPKAASRRKTTGTRAGAASTATRAAGSKAKAAAKKAKTSGARKTARTGAARATTKTTAKAAKKKAPARKAAAKSSRRTGASGTARRPVAKRPAAKKTAAGTRKTTVAVGRNRRTGSEPRRREIEGGVPTPPSSLDMNRHGSAARTGRAEIAEERADHANMTPAITGGDVDADVENAYFSGDEAPGGDNPTPDQDIVDDIGRALGVEYQDNEELRASDKVADRDRHRWELDPASAEDYKDRS